MFTGEYWFSMDQKGRVSVPAKYREELGTEFKICKGFDKCLNIYPAAEWDAFAQKLKALPEASQRHARRYFFSGTIEGVLDGQGRVAVTQSLRQFAGLEKDVVIIGNENHLEIWSASAWADEQKFMSSEGITEELSEYGF